MSVNLHILNAGCKLNAIRERIEQVFPAALEFISTLLPISDVDVVIRANRFALPETGIGGYSPAADVVYLSIDPDNENLLKDFDTEFRATLGHELHHCKRHRGPGYGFTLGEALITEGLACHFETELRGGALPFYARALDDGALLIAWERAQSELQNSSYDHRSWFFGSPEKDLLRHTGYTLGFNIVAHYLRNVGVPASKLWAESPETFFTAPNITLNLTRGANAPLAG